MTGRHTCTNSRLSPTVETVTGTRWCGTHFRHCPIEGGEARPGKPWRCARAKAAASEAHKAKKRTLRAEGC